MYNIGQGNKLSRIISQLDEVDATERYAVNGADNRMAPQDGSRIVDGPPRKVISWDEDDPENPYNWPIVSLRLVYEIKCRIDVW
jgi:hypothetical protein